MNHRYRWTPQKIADRLRLIEPLIYRRKVLLPVFRFKALATALEMPAPDVDATEWQTIPYNSYWGAWDVNFVMHSSFTIPPDWDPSTSIALHLRLGDAVEFCHPETLVYVDGVPLAASDRAHEEIVLPNHLCDENEHRLMLHGWTGIGYGREPLTDTNLFMRECFLVQIDAPTREFFMLARLALDVAEQLDANDRTQSMLYNALDRAFLALDTRDPLDTPAFYDSVSQALELLQVGTETAGSPLDVKLLAVGHAHIDTAWLWNLDQTVRKTGRTFSTVLHLMNLYPEFKFSQSQPQLYQYIERHYPQLFTQIKERVQEGRWEVMGGTWVEPDCNAIGAESLARQFLLGRSYFRNHFGDVETPVLWLPDTFGYSWALPQLIRQAGLKYFVTHKMSWNQYNQMPHQFFWWQGLDGTRVLTYFLTTPAPMPGLPHATTYNGIVNASEVLGAWRGFRQKETHDEVLMPFGEGDGGGGPTRQMLDNIKYLADFPGTPRLRFGKVHDFLERLEQSAQDNLPVWNGEFYLEYHRGTYTSQGRTKRNNRKCEVLLHDAEFLAAWAALAVGYEYPHDELTYAWQLLCLNQFHDILPGSSIGQVYVDAERDYRTIRQIGERVRDEALNALGMTLPLAATLAAINTTSFAGRRIGLFAEHLPQDRHLEDRDGNFLVTQAVEGGTLVEIPHAAAYSMVGLREVTGQQSSSEASEIAVWQDSTTTILENALLRVEINQMGEIHRLYDKAMMREVLPLGEVANRLLAFEDRPLSFDAWDVDVFYEDRMEPVLGLESLAIIESGPLRVGVEIKRRYRSSTIVQRIYLYSGSRRLDFDTWVDWHEHHILLKVAFPTNIMSPVATFDVQWGNVQRPTHRNTPWDMARFETCAHQWVDLSEGNYGVALLNDCKYGYDVHHNTLRLSLIKSATDPDPDADQGEHRFVYSLLPHPGDWRGEVVRSAYDLNIPLLLKRIRGAAGVSPEPLVSLNVDYVLIETIKLAEDGNGLIVRLYENQRNRGTVMLKVGFEIASAHLCNLLEETEHALDIIDNTVQLQVTPYQISTVRLVGHP